MSEKVAIVLRPEEPRFRPSVRRKRWRFLVLVLVSTVTVGAVLFVAYYFYSEHKNPGLRDLTKRAERGNISAQLELAEVYQQGRNGVDKDLARAAVWYRRAANSGDPRGQYKLGTLYWNGEGVSKDYEAAFQLFMKSALQGFPKAELSLGKAYAQGLGVPQNYAESYRWTRKAAEHGNARAPHVLCLMYAGGIGVQKDPTLGYAWCLIAKAEGDELKKDKDEKGVREPAEMVGKRLNQSQKAEAQSLAAAWWAGRDQHSPMPDRSKHAKTPETKAPSVTGSKNYSASTDLTPRGSVPAFHGGIGNLPSAPSDCDSGHWVESVSSNGEVVRLEDGSVWRVSAADISDTLLWLPTEDISVCDGRLINTDSGDAVTASRY